MREETQRIAFASRLNADTLQVSCARTVHSLLLFRAMYSADVYLVMCNYKLSSLLPLSTSDRQAALQERTAQLALAKKELKDVKAQVHNFCFSVSTFVALP